MKGINPIDPIDPQRWHVCWHDDSDVLRSLRSHGDVPEIVREVDVSFRGSLANLKLLASACGNFGFSVQRFEEADESGSPWLFLVRNQPTDDATMRDLCTTYLQIEDAFDVECDGWGCLAHNHNGPISKENPA